MDPLTPPKQPVVISKKDNARPALYGSMVRLRTAKSRYSSIDPTGD